MSEERLAALEAEVKELQNKVKELLGCALNAYEKNHERREPERRSPEWTDVICSNCNVACSVPFRPKPGRMAYCRDCYHRRKVEKSFQLAEKE